jgi:hypothetical protein
MKEFEPFGTSLAKAYRATFSASHENYFEWLDLLKIIKHEPGDNIDVYFIGEHSHITGKHALIHPLHIRAYDPHDPKRKMYCYKFDQLRTIIHDKNPIYNDFRISHKNVIKPEGVNLFRIYTGQTRQIKGNLWIKAQIVTPDASISSAIIEKYNEITDMKRSDIYKLNALFRKCIQSKALDVINRFKHLALNKIR